MTPFDPEVRMSHLTGRDARQAMAKNPVILIPMGSQEDQGPHAPMGDFLIPQRVAELAAQQAHLAGTPVYVAPVLPYGGEDFFRSAVGGIIVQPTTMMAVLHDVLMSLIDNGLTRIIIINGHQGNISPITASARRISVERGIVVPAVNMWEAAYLAMPGIIGAEETKKRASHGSDPLASVALHLFPELVRRDYMPEQIPMSVDPLLGLNFLSLGRADLNGVPVALPSDYADVFHDGVGEGDPRLSNADTGKQLVDILTAAIRDLAVLLTEKTA